MPKSVAECYPIMAASFTCTPVTRKRVLIKNASAAATCDPLSTKPCHRSCVTSRFLTPHVHCQQSGTISQISQGHNAPPGFCRTSSRSNRSSRTDIKLVGEISKLHEQNEDECSSPTDSTSNRWSTAQNTAVAAALVLVTHKPGHLWASRNGAYISCCICARRATNIVEVGALSCCWQCVAEQYN
jgi:hypothetical protein